MFEPKPSKAHCCNCGQGRHNSSAPRVGQNALPRRVFAAATAAMVLGLGWTRMDSDGLGCCVVSKSGLLEKTKKKPEQLRISDAGWRLIAIV